LLVRKRANRSYRPLGVSDIKIDMDSRGGTQRACSFRMGKTFLCWKDQAHDRRGASMCLAGSVHRRFWTREGLFTVQAFEG
jgi:hypothetical protein